MQKSIFPDNLHFNLIVIIIGPKYPILYIK